jgi:dTDP-4-dehydrorhamnose reductase
MNKILVTGSEGMLGKALMESLKANGIQAIGIDIKSAENSLDITDYEKTKVFIGDIKPDTVIHTAAFTDVDMCEESPEKAYAVNARGAENITRAVKDLKAFLIYISTDYVFDGKNNTPYTEEDTPNPISVYGKTKLEGENFIRNALSDYLIIRTSWLFGKGGKNFVDTIINKAQTTKTLKVVNDQTGSPTYAFDLAEAIRTLLVANRNLQFTAVLNITNQGACTWYEFAKEIIKLKGIKGVDIVPIQSSESSRPAKRPGMSILDCSKYKKLINKPLPLWQNALERYLIQGGK